MEIRKIVAKLHGFIFVLKFSFNFVCAGEKSSLLLAFEHEDWFIQKWNSEFSSDFISTNIHELKRVYVDRTDPATVCANKGQHE